MEFPSEGLRVSVKRKPSKAFIERCLPIHLACLGQAGGFGIVFFFFFLKSLSSVFQSFSNIPPELSLFAR